MKIPAIDMRSDIEADIRTSFVGAELRGKNVLLKREICDVADRQCRIVAIDRTEANEYALLARRLGRDITIVDRTSTPYPLDPFRIFGSRIGARGEQR